MRTTTLSSAGLFHWELLVSLGLIVGDQVLKYQTTDPFLNTSGPFSIPINNELAFLIELLFIALLTFLFFARWRGESGLVLVIGGGLSNAITRLTSGGVIDVWQLGNAVFNLADVTIVIGAMMFITLATTKATQTIK